MTDLNDTSSISSMDSDDSLESSKYSKVTHEEHIELAPDTYVGSIESEATRRYVYVDPSEEEPEGKIELRDIKIVPALYKIFDEVLVNAADHWQRLNSEKDVKHLLTEIHVNFNEKTNEIVVENDGEGIDIEFMKDHNMYPPTLIFGHLLTGTNYDKTQEKTWGGKNGYGAKLANIFSTEFKVETIDSKRGLKFTQTFKNNMKIKEEPVIVSCKSKPMTKISFKPDLSKFGLTKLDEDHLSLFKLRVYDMAAWTDKKVSIFLNNNKIAINSFERYTDLYLGGKDETPRIYQKINDRWEVVVTYSNDDTFQQVSLVNGINTCRGGKHVDYIADQIKDSFITMIQKKKKLDIKGPIIKNQLFVFVKAIIVNPCFDSQTKETLTTSKKNFGSTAVLDVKFMEKLYKTPILERILNLAEFKSQKNLKKSDGRRTKTIIGIPKLCDANKAGSIKDSVNCTLILTEGDSAKTTAVSGLSEVGRDLWGVFPLRGKLLNVKDLPMEKVFKNEEIQNIVKILGLKVGSTYKKDEGEWGLRYGRILIMADQDLDGTHIKGLVMNLFHTYWPSLLENDFITTMITPIVKASKKKEVLNFYNLFDYNNWKTGDKNKGNWKIKYYKGLGTSNSQEAKEYFKTLHIQEFKYDANNSNQALNLAFDKTQALERKMWLKTYNESDVLDYNCKDISYKDFVNKELIHFSHADCLRSIPDIHDGLKPSQRKIIYSCFKKNLKDEMKVAQLAGYVGEHSSYHHGEASLMGAITAIAQDFIGSNNLNLLLPCGQFGTRLMGGKDASSPRYIFTKLAEITSLIFRPEDSIILDYLNDDGFKIEPKYYKTIIPLILINGTRGIGTGWSSTVPCYNPIEVIDCIENKINDREIKKLSPWYRNFEGDILFDKTNYITKGKYTIQGAYDIHITELPIGTWTQSYKEFLDSSVKDKNNEDSKKSFLKSYSDYSTECKVDFRLKLCKSYVDYLGKDGDTSPLDTLLKIKSSADTNIKNMVLYNSKGVLTRYNDTVEIIEDFYGDRLKGYEDRRERQIQELEKESNILQDKVKFIELILSGDLDMRGKQYKYVELELQANGLRKLVGSPPSYDYITDMKMSSQTKERVDELNKKYNDKQQELNSLLDTTPKEIWLKELKQLKEVIVKLYKDNQKKKVVKTTRKK